MNNYEKIYWLTRLDKIEGLFCTISILSIILLVVIYVGCAMSADFDEFKGQEKQKERKATRVNLKKNRYWLVPLMVISALITTLTPTRNEAIIIMAGGKTMDYIQTDTSLSKIPYQTTSIISEYLDKTINELKKENK